MHDPPRVFVSSIMEGYSEFRQAARSAIERAGGRPVLVEDEPSRSDSPRNACLDLVASSDAVVTLVGPRGGYRAPSGKLVVQEEFEEARKRGIPTVVFLQDVDRDPDGEELASTLSDWVTGRLRRTFATPEELATEVEQALQPTLDTMSRPNRDPQTVQQTVSDPSHGAGHHGTVLRLAFAPVVQEEEVIDPLQLDDPDLKDTLMRLAHESGLFSYEHPKEVDVSSRRIEIVQRSQTQQAHARIALTTSGEVIVERQLTGPKGSADGWRAEHFSSTFEILKSDIERSAEDTFGFLHRLLDEIDPHQRYVGWLYNAALVNPGMRRIVDEPARSNRGHPASINKPEVVTSHDDPRRITRQTLAEPGTEAHRIANLLQKRLDEARSY